MLNNMIDIVCYVSDCIVHLYMLLYNIVILPGILEWDVLYNMLFNTKFKIAYIALIVSQLCDILINTRVYLTTLHDM